MSRERVNEYLKKYNMDNRIITVEGISATVKEAAEALGTKEERIAKTLSFKLKDKYIVVVTSGDAKIDNAKYRHTFGEKAHMVSSDMSLSPKLPVLSKWDRVHFTIRRLLNRLYILLWTLYSRKCADIIL